MNRRQKIIVSVTGIFLVLLILVGLTYAYFLTRIIGNTNNKSISVTTANLSLKYDDGNGVLTAESKLVPNTTVSEKTFSVENTGDTKVDSYGVTLEDLEISYVNDFTDNNGNLVTAGTSTYLEYPSDFKIRITCESSDPNKDCNGYDGSMPSTNDVLLKNSIDEDEIHTYTLTLTYIDSGIDQSKDMNKTIEAKIDIIDTKGTIDVEGTVTNYVAGDYVQVNSEPKVSYINKDGKYKVVGLDIENHTISIYNGTTKKSFTTINVEKGETANVNSTNNTATVTNVERNITVDINASSGNYTLTKIDNGVKNGTPAYYAQLDELKVGDYVIYNYTPGTYTTTEVDDDGVSQSFDSSSDSIISSDKWRVLSVDEDVVQIIPDIREVPKLQMYGAKGYLNGPTVLNEMAEALYSGDMGTARSINAVDINKKVGYNNSIWYTNNGMLTKVPVGITTLSELELAINLKINNDYRIMPDGEDVSNLKLNYYSYYVYERKDQKDEQGNLKYINKFLMEDFVKDNALYDMNGQNIEFELLAYHTIEEKYGVSFNPNIITQYSPYWVADRAEDISLNSNSDNSYIKYGIRQMSNASFNRKHMWNAKEGAQDADDKPINGVVPIVTLKNDLQIEKKSNGQWELK